MVDNFRLTVDSNTEIEPLETVRDVRMKGQSLVDNRVATIPQMTGATSSSNGSAGVVPTPSVGDREKYLRGDGTWAEASGGGGSNVSVDQILDDGVNIMDITIDNVTTHIYAPESDPNAVVDVVDANGDSLVDEYRVAHVEESVTDVVDANGDSLVDANGVAHVTGEVVDVVNGDGDSLVDENGIAHVTGDITDVLYDNKSVVNEDGVAELFSDRKITTLPLLDYENETVISGSATWRDTTVHRWTAPCDCVVYIFDQAGSNDTFVRYTIDDFVYYGTVIGRKHNAPYGLCSNFLPVKKGQEITIQLLGQMMNNLYNKAYYIPYKTVDENANDFPLPYLDHDNKISIDYSVTSFTAQTDGVVVDYGNGVNTIKITVNGFETTYYGKGGSQYFDCNVPVSTGDVVTLGQHSGKYFIPFKRTDNVNKLVSPIPDYTNRVVYSGDTLPTSFEEEGFLFLCAHDSSTYLSGVSVDYIIDSQNTLNVWAYKYAVSGTNYWKDSFAPINKTMTKSYASTGNNVNYYFIPYSKFESQYVKDVQVKGTSIVKAGGIANIESMVTDVQNPKGESLVGEGGIATVSGKVFDVQLEGISILDENAVANLKSNMGTFVSPILDYDRIGFVEESKTWIDRNPHNWTAPCDCVVFSCSPNGYGCVFSIDGEFTYKAYKNALGNYNSSAYASYYSMLPVAEGSVVTFSQIGQKDTTASYKMAYIPYKKATTLQSTYTLPYLDYENKTAIEWASPIIANELICEYTAPIDGYVSIDLLIGSNTTPTVTYTVNNNSNVNVMTRAMETNYYPNGIILGKGDTVSIYDAGNVPTYTYTGNIYFTPFTTTSSLREVVSPIPDYANLETLDLTDFPTTFDAGYIFNCAERQGDNLLKYCKITLSDSVKIYTRSAPYDVIHEYSYFPISGDETLVSVEYETNAGNVYYIPYSEVEVTPILVSDVEVNGTSVVDANGVAHITGGGGGSTVTVTPIQTTGTKIAEIDVDGVTSDLYAPNGGGGGSTVSVTQKVSSGENIASITVDGVATELYATNTTYSDFVGATSESAGTHGLVPAPTSEDRLKYLRANGTWGTPTNTTYSDFTGATSQAAGAHGLVPAPTTSDTAKFLKGDGSWGTPDSGSDVSVTQIQSTGTKIATVTIDNVDTDLYAPNGGGGGASELDDLDDVEITSPTNGQILKYNGTTQKWENDIITFDTSDDLFSYISTLRVSDRYASASISNHSFNFNLNDYADDWSTSATINNNTAIDITDYNSIEIDVTISEQADNGYLWITLSTTNYTWGGGEFPSIYKNVDSAIKISESGTYSVDVSELSGNYYIYIGGTSGKNSVTHASENNSLNGKIIGSVTEIRGVMESAIPSITPNPEGTPTDTLNTIEIDGVIYDLPSGSGSASDIVKIYDSGSDTTPATQNTDITYIDGIDISNYDLIMAAYSSDRGESADFPQTLYATGIIDEILNDTDNDWVVAGYADRWAMLDIGATSFRVTAGGYGIYKLYAIKLGSGGSGGTIEVEQIPQMTSATTPSGSVSRSSVAANQHEGWCAFNGIPASPTQLTNAWLSNSDDYTPWIRYDWTTLKKFHKISIQVTNNGTEITRQLTIEGKTEDTWENCLKSGETAEVVFYQGDLTTYEFRLNGKEYSALRITGNDRFYTGSGGSAGGFSQIQVFELENVGGNANIEELTQGEYNVLPSSQKENGTMYLVHDGDEEVDLTVRMTGYTSISGTASAVGSLNANFLAWHAFASENTFNANVNGEYWAGNGEGAYLQFDFANAVSITKVAYASYQYSSFDLMYSTDGTTYTKAETLTQADQGTTTPTKQDYTLSEPIANVVSIRFVCNGTYNIGALHIYGNDGDLTPNRIYLNGRKYAEVSNGITLSSVGLTQAEYDVLPTVQKEDTSKLYLVNDTGATAINMYYTTKFVENNVTITDYEHKTVLAWSNGNSIGQTWYYTTPIDVTDIDTIQYNITTGSSTYGSVNSHNDVRNLGFGLRDTAPSAMTLINSMNFDLYNEYHDVNDLNKTLVEEELDVSEMTGEYYLIGTGAGWNAEISNIVLVSGDGVNKKCIYWDDTVYGESRSDNLVGEKMTLSEYELLPAATKKDGTVRFIPSSPASESEAIDMEHIQSFIENPSCMAVAATSDTLTTVSYLGNVYIGCNYYYTTPIDVTGWDKIIMDVETGNCYGGGTQATQQQFFLYIGLMENAPVTTFNPTQVTWVTSVNYGLSNHDYSGTELDVKELSGEYYLVLSCHGWSATIENIQLANLGGYASQIKYMDETYGIANIMELTEGDYQELTNVEKNNGTVYFTYDGGYDFINYNDGEIIVRVNNDTDEMLWFFNGYSKGTAEDVPVPSELTEYIPSWVRTVADTYMQAKSWSDDTSTTQNGWVGFVNVAGTPMIRGWSVDFTTKVNISSWAVLDANGDHTQGGQTADYSNPYEGISITPNRIYLNGRKYAEVSDVSGGNIQTTFDNIYQSPTQSAEQTITLSAPMTDFDLLILNTTMGSFMQPMDTIEEETYIGGGNDNNYIWYDFDLITPTILTKAYQGGGVFIRNIQGVKFGSGGGSESTTHYHVFGIILDSHNGGTMTARGCADITITGNLARVDFMITEKYNATHGDGYSWGINPALFTQIDSNIPLITPIEKQGSWDVFGYNSDRMQYGTTFDVSGDRWRPVRYYNTNGDIGSWSETTIPNQYRGTCYGTIQS